MRKSRFKEIDRAGPLGVGHGAKLADVLRRYGNTEQKPGKKWRLPSSGGRSDRRNPWPSRPTSVAAVRSYPIAVVYDNAPEFRGEALDNWAHQYWVHLAFIQPGRPAKNGHTESFKGKFGDE